MPYLKISRPLIAALLSIGVSVASQAAQIDPNTGEGAVKLDRKLQCSLNDGEEVTFKWSGRAYSRVPGVRDKHLFNLVGMNVRQCTTIKDPKRGTGFKMVSREIMLYLDPKTSEILRTWDNPWTGNKDEVIHVANDPVNSRPFYPINKDGKDKKFSATFLNGTYFAAFEVPLFYTNPLGGEYQEQIGGVYHGTEIFDFSGNEADLLDADAPIEYGNIAWVRIAQWLPWMNMGGRSGIMYFNAVGKKLQSWDQLPKVLKDEIKANYPAYTNAPPLDDKRKNETSWTYMKKIIDQRKADAEKGKQ